MSVRQTRTVTFKPQISRFKALNMKSFMKTKRKQESANRNFLSNPRFMVGSGAYVTAGGATWLGGSVLFL